MDVERALGDAGTGEEGHFEAGLHLAQLLAYDKPQGLHGEVSLCYRRWLEGGPWRSLCNTSPIQLLTIKLNYKTSLKGEGQNKLSSIPLPLVDYVRICAYGP